MTRDEGHAIELGDVVQIMPEYDPGDGSRNGWVGAFVLVTEVKQFGVQGFVQQIESHAKYGSAYIRLKWEHIEYIGRAKALPADLHQEMHDGSPSDGG